MENGSASTVLLGLVLLGVGLVAGLLIARSPAEDDDLEPRVAEIEEWVAEARHEVAALRREVEPVEPLLEMMRVLEPRLEGMRGKAEQFAAVATLRSVISAQAQLQASGKIDVDQDGVGEYGGFKEMSGDRPGRMSYDLRPAILSPHFKTLTEHGEATRGGYHFRIYLPHADGSGVGEPAEGFTKDDPVDPDLAERLFRVYAWPAERTSPPKPTYFTNQLGDVLSTRDAAYAGSGNGPAPDAAEGQDGNTWKLEN